VDARRTDFAQAAAADGVVLDTAEFDWLCEQGHVGLERVAKARRDPAIVEPVIAALQALQAMFARLGGDTTVLHAARENLLLPVDLFHEPTQTIVELDGPEHFTSFRLTALGLYPPDARVGYDLDDFKTLCRELAPQTDRLHRGLAAKGFGFGGVQRERAYHDALKDLGAPAMGLAPVIRIAVTTTADDGAALYLRHRDELRSTLSRP
jgi:hypothetical protein